MDEFDPGAWSALITAVLIGIAAIVGAFARPLFTAVFAGKHRPGCPITETAVNHIAELHDWHGPDDRGAQAWRGHGIVARLESMQETQSKGFEQTNELLRELITVTRKA